MSFISYFIKNKKEKDIKKVNTVSGHYIKLSIDGVSSSDVGVLTNNTSKDFYVYDWFIKDKGEIFYVGMGRNDRYKDFHGRAYEAEKIREMFDTDIRFVGKNLTEEEAIALESKEMTRILNETNDRLTNR